MDAETEKRFNECIKSLPHRPGAHYAIPEQPKEKLTTPEREYMAHDIKVLEQIAKELHLVNKNLQQISKSIKLYGGK